MKRIVKLAVKYILYGILIGCTSFVIMCLSYSMGGGEDTLMKIFDDFTRQSLGAILVGIACGGTAIVYQFDRPSFFVENNNTFLRWNGRFLLHSHLFGLDTLLSRKKNNYGFAVFIFMRYFYGDMVLFLSV